MKNYKTYEVAICANQDVDMIEDYEERELLEEEIINERIETLDLIEKWCNYNTSTFDMIDKYRCIISTNKEVDLVQELDEIEALEEEIFITYDLIEE